MSAAVKTANQTESVITIDPRRVRPFEGQPRKYFDRDELISLELSLKQHGQLQPGLVRKIAGQDHDYELVDGQRRWLACTKLALPFRAIVVETENIEDQYKMSLAANFQRADHTPMEIARAIERLDKAGRERGYIAMLFGKSRQWVYDMSRLVTLASELQMRLGPPTPEKDRLPLTLATHLARLKASDQLAILEEFERQGLTGAAAISRIDRVLRSEGVIAQRHTKPADFTRMVTRYLNSAIAKSDELLERWRPETAGVLRKTAKLQPLRAQIQAAIQKLQTLDERLRGITGNSQRPEPEPRLHTAAKPVDYVYSHILKCAKCGNRSTRFRRRRDADPLTGSWECLGKGCLIRMAHVRIPVDTLYRPLVRGGG